MDSNTTSSAFGKAPLSQPAYAFAGFRLQPDGSLFRGDTPVHLAPMELAALRLLIARAGEIVTPLELNEALWGDVHVTPGSLPRCMSSLRARLEPEDCIQTIYKRGYRLNADVQAILEPAGTTPRLAVLPFLSQSDIPLHIGPGIADEIIALLSNAPMPAVSVLARDSVFTLARRGLSAVEIGKALHADLALTGTVRALPAMYRLRAEMTRVADGLQIWVEDTLLAQTRVFDLESDFASQIAFRLNQPAAAVSRIAPSLPVSTPDAAWQAPGVPLSGEPGASIPEDISSSADPDLPSSSPAASRGVEAADLFRRAHYEWQSHERHRMQDGLQHLTRAAELEPGFVAAKVDLARLCITQAFYGFMASSKAADLIRRSAESIPDLVSQAPEILPALGWVYYNVDHNLPAALWAFSRSNHLPHNIWNTRERVMFALSRHRFGEAGELNQVALREDPFSPGIHARAAWIAHLAGRREESLAQVERCLALNPEHDSTILYSSIILAFNGQTDRAVQISEGRASRTPKVDIAAAFHAYALACAGRSAEARAVLDQLEWLSRERFVLRSFHPAVHLALGDTESAIAELRAAAADRCPWFLQTLADPRLAPLHTHPDFQDLRSILTRMEANLETALAEENSPFPEI